MLCVYNVLDLLFAFTSALLVNLAVVYVSANTFHNGGFVGLTLHDVHVLMEQVLNNFVAPIAFGLALLCAGQLSTLTGAISGSVQEEGLHKTNIRPWLRRLTMRIIAIVPASICVWRYGNEDTYQMLVLSQVILALQLPFAIVPLIKIFASKGLIGSNKYRVFEDGLAWSSISIMCVVNMWLVFDLLFGEGVDGTSFEVMAGFEWSIGYSVQPVRSMVFAAVFVVAGLTLGLLMWTFFTPAKTENCDVETQRQIEPNENHNYCLGQLEGDVLFDKVRPTSQTEALESQDLPGNQELHTCENLQNARLTGSSDYSVKISEDNLGINALTTREMSQSESPASSNHNSVSSQPLPPVSTPSAAPMVVSSVDKNTVVLVEPAAEDRETSALNKAEAEADADTGLLGKDDYEGDTWETLEHEDILVESCHSSVNGVTNLSQGPEASKCIIGRTDTSEGTGGGSGSGSGSLSRLSGLGRAARRQFAAILDEFWGNLFDLHGQPVAGKLNGVAINSGMPGIDQMAPDHTVPEVSNQQQHITMQQKWSWPRPSNLTDQVGQMDAYLRAHSHATASTSTQLSQDWAQGMVYCPNYGNERRYSSMRFPSYHDKYDYQPATFHGCRNMSVSALASLKASPLQLNGKCSESGSGAGLEHLRDGDPVSLQKKESKHAHDSSSQFILASAVVNTAPNISGSDRFFSESGNSLDISECSRYDSSQWDPLAPHRTGRWNPLVYRATGELDIANMGGSHPSDPGFSSFGHSPIGRRREAESVDRAPLVFDELSPSQSHREGFSIQNSGPCSENHSLWSRQPFEQLFGASDAEVEARSRAPLQNRSSSQQTQARAACNSFGSVPKAELELLQALRLCIGKLLQLEGSDWLFRMDNGADEDLMTAISTMQKIETEVDESSSLCGGEQQLWDNQSQTMKSRKDYSTPRKMASIPYCGEGCVWDKSLLISFGVWCVHRVLELSLMESRPELWGKYTYVLNRLQGILEPAFSKPRAVPSPCACFSNITPINGGKQRSLSRQGMAHDNGDFISVPSYLQAWPWGCCTGTSRGKGACALVFMEMIKEVEAAVGSRKGRTGTAAGDVAFPKGKENLASVLKRYKRRLTTKGSNRGSGGKGSRKGAI